MDQIDAMRIFLRVAELASFTDAAASLGLPKASISAAVQRLETRLGTRLLHRTTRRVQLTQDGLAFSERCRDLIADYDELDALFRPEPASLDGRLRVDMPSGVARDLVLPALPAFLAEHPELAVELSGTDRRVDLVREGFDCVLRVGALDESSLVARPLGRWPLVNVASAGYVARHGRPATPADLADGHRLVHYLPAFGLRSPGFEYVDADGATRFVPMAGALSVNSSETYTAAALAGLGIIQSPASVMQGHLDSGALVEVLPGYRAAPMPVTLLYAHRRQLPRRVRVFMDWIEALLAPQLLRD
ncbi:LysR family transcriptional regulator [Derxia gummosa]|uniref:LysR family transcriptional regulator n=1 Tax=Derxia gummosa DSM 723 TaxID=1121388 RepID=A0A8B6X4J1_9BURK|nr:LysR family transcriptional regulator [Derxia gummosa]